MTRSRPAMDGMARTVRDTGALCAACSAPGDLRRIGVVLCRTCRDLLVVACLRKIRREVPPPTGQTYPCEFCLGLHLSGGWDASTVPPAYVRAREQLRAALAAAGLIGPTLNPNSTD